LTQLILLKKYLKKDSGT